MKSCTDIPQSKRLAEILPKESADMSYDWFVIGKKYSNIPQCRKFIDDELPCWSLTALLNVLDYPQLSKDKLGSGKIGWMVSVYPNDCRYDSCWHNNPVDACVELIERMRREEGK